MVAPPDPSLAPRAPDPYGFLYEITREQDPRGILRALIGEGDFSPELDAADPRAIEGLWGLVNYFAYLAFYVRQGEFWDPRTAHDDAIDRIARKRGISPRLIRLARAPVDTAVGEANVRRLGILAPLLLRWIATRDGGGIGGLIRGIRAFTRHRPVLRENFHWQQFVSEAPGPSDPYSAFVQRDLTLFDATTAPWIYDLHVIDWPQGSIVDWAVIRELVDLGRAVGETVYLHRVRWADDFFEAAAVAREDWILQGPATATLAVSVPDRIVLVPPGDPMEPVGTLRLTRPGAGAESNVYPTTCAFSTWGADCLAQTHYVEFGVFFDETGSPPATRQFHVDVNWAPSGAGDAAYRVTLSNSGTVQILADNPGPPVTVRATNAAAFLPGLLSADRVRVSISVEVLGATKKITGYVDGVQVVTWTDAAVLQATAGTVRLGTPAFDFTLSVSDFLYGDFPGAPTLVEPVT